MFVCTPCTEEAGIREGSVVSFHARRLPGTAWVRHGLCSRPAGCCEIRGRVPLCESDGKHCAWCSHCYDRNFRSEQLSIESKFMGHFHHRRETDLITETSSYFLEKETMDELHKPSISDKPSIERFETVIIHQFHAWYSASSTTYGPRPFQVPYFKTQLIVYIFFFTLCSPCILISLNNWTNKCTWTPDDSSIAADMLKQ